MSRWTIKDHLYAVRTKGYDIEDGVVSVLTGQSSVQKLKPISGKLYEAADGKSTVKDIIHSIASREGVEPARLVGEIKPVIHDMKLLKMLELSDTPKDLPYYYSMPGSELDKEKVEAEKRKDGYYSG